MSIRLASFLCSDPMSSASPPFVLEECRWAWCRSTFPSHSELERHVIDDHVRVAVPIRLSQLSAVVRAEDGVGESLNITQLINNSVTDSQLSTLQRTDSSQGECTSPLLVHDSPVYIKDSKHSNTQQSSLPSPPQSIHSTSPRQHQNDHEDDDEMLPTNPEQLATFLFPDREEEHSLMDDFHTSSQDEVPTFASLSAPSPTSQAVDVPPSPSFNFLVTGGAATNAASQRSTSPQDSVARALTQPNPPMDDGGDSPLPIDAVPRLLHLHSTRTSGHENATSPDNIQQDSSYYDELPQPRAGTKRAAVITPHRSPQTQSWYQTKRRRSSASIKSGHSSPRISSTPQSPVFSGHHGSAELHNGGSPLKQTSSLQEDDGNANSSQSDWSDIASQAYAQLQTQAPYDSQPFESQ